MRKSYVCNGDHVLWESMCVLTNIEILDLQEYMYFPTCTIERWQIDLIKLLLESVSN